VLVLLWAGPDEQIPRAPPMPERQTAGGLGKARTGTRQGPTGQSEVGETAPQIPGAVRRRESGSGRDG